MAQSSKTFQYQATMSINREKFIDKVVTNESLTKKDLRVLMYLMTHIDAKVYKSVSKKSIAETLNMSKKDVATSLDNLCYECIISRGDSETVRGGYKSLF